MKHAIIGLVAAIALCGPFAAQAQTASTAPGASDITDPAYTAAPSEVGEKKIAQMQGILLDLAGLARYRDADAQLAPHVKGRVVFFGDSITDLWGSVEGSEFFPGKPYVNRGISGQTTAQMLVRFRQDVIDLNPQAVVILAGTNDVAGNTGPSSLAMSEDNLRSMCELAKAHRIKVILASVLPASAFPWRPGYKPAQKIRDLNAWIREYASEQGLVYLDYYDAMSNADGGLDPQLAKDGVHPTAAGYAIMAPLAQAAIDKAL